MIGTWPARANEKILMRMTCDVVEDIVAIDVESIE